ncbi:MAG: class I SAM-dependent methyltransferase [Acidobacteria bacterium]|nr:class I SAM-dependent methyltransferase [Acidobacteriota bacterium]
MTDARTADAFASSWNRVGGVYSREQFLEWFVPLTEGDLAGCDVLELGFGNGSLLAHVAAAHPRRLAGIELGDTIEQTRRIVGDAAELHRGDLTTANLGEFDVVYCIGVLHHLKDPRAGFESVLRHTKPGGRFHCWVYAHEGNGIIRWVVDPLRRIASRLPWWLTKYGLALPLVTPYFLYAKLMQHFPFTTRLPLGAYTLWIAREPFRFFHHVAFDQLVTPQTAYLRRSTIEEWLRDPRVGQAYVRFRNGNSWIFGGTRAE